MLACLRGRPSFKLNFQMRNGSQFEFSPTLAQKKNISVIRKRSSFFSKQVYPIGNDVRKIVLLDDPS